MPFSGAICWSVFSPLMDSSDTFSFRATRKEHHRGCFRLFASYIAAAPLFLPAQIYCRYYLPLPWFMPLIINPSLQSGYCFNTSDISYCGGLVSWYLESSHAPSFWDWVHEQQIKWTIIQETQRKAVERGLIIGLWYQIAMIMSFFFIVIQWSAMFLRY